MENVWLVKVWAVLGSEFVKRRCCVPFTALDLNGNDIFLPSDFRVRNQKIYFHVTGGVNAIA